MIHNSINNSIDDNNIEDAVDCLNKKESGRMKRT